MVSSPRTNSRNHLLVIFCSPAKLQAENTGARTGIIEHACDRRPEMGPNLKRKTNTEMLCAAYDILRKDATDMVWVEAVHDLEAAKLRVKELASRSDEEYVIFDQRTRKIVANGSSLRPRL